MRVITLAQQKGGVGKSTLAIHLAAEAVRKGRRAVILELDRQGTASFWSDSRVYTAEAKEGDLLAKVDRAKMPPEVLKIESSQLERMLTALTGLGVDVAVVDLPGTHSPAVGAAIKAADFVLIPTRAHEIDITASAETLAAVQRLDKDYAYVLTFVEGSGGAKRAEEATDLLDEVGHLVAPQTIGRRNVFADAIAEGKTAMEKEPNGKAATEIRQLWNWITSKLESANERSEETRVSRASGRSGQPSAAGH